MTGRTVLVTGGLGFIGGRFVHRWLSRHPDDQIVNVDVMSYAADEARLGNPPMDRHRLVQGDIAQYEVLEAAMKSANMVFHFAAESHVDRSIRDAAAFVRTNVQGTHAMLEAARRTDVQRIHHVSTDEVFGSLPLGGDDVFTEGSPFAPRSPYAATKAAADHLVDAYVHTYGLNITVSHGSNTYGPFQYPEKFIPRLVTRGLSGQSLPVYGDGSNVRDWIHVDDHCDAIEQIALKGQSGRRYCVGANNEVTNLEVARAIIRHLGLAPSAIEFVDDRPGHDLRYAMETSRIRSELAWKPKIEFEPGLKKTIQWYQENRSWWTGHQPSAEALYAPRRTT